MNNELTQIVEWMKVNKQKPLNVGKTNCMAFTLDYSMRRNHLPITIDGHIIETVQETKFLGVVIQNDLRWTAHMKHVCSKLAKAIGILYKARSKLSVNTLLMLYCAFLYPNIYYCNTVWGGGSTVHLNPIHLLQKRAIRAIYGSSHADSTAQYFAESRIMTVFQVNLYYVILFVYRWHHGLLPPLFNSFFSIRSTIHSRNTRGVLHLNFIKCRTEMRKGVIESKEQNCTTNIFSHFFFEVPSFQIFKKNLRSIVMS